MKMRHHYFTSKQQNNLLLLETYLRTIKKKDFRFDRQVNNSCGTPGCAMGHAATLPEFIEQGIMMVSDGSINFWVTGDFRGVFGYGINVFYLNHELYPDMKWDNVRPEHVANAILDMLDNATIVDEEKS